MVATVLTLLRRLGSTVRPRHRPAAAGRARRASRRRPAARIAERAPAPAARLRARRGGRRRWRHRRRPAPAEAHPRSGSTRPQDGHGCACGHNKPMAESLRGKLLLASPTLLDPNFVRTVVLIAEHTEEGAMGLGLNRPADVTGGEGAPELDEL